MEKVYVLDVRVPKQDNKRIEVLNEIQLGSDEQCDLRILDHGLSPLQGRFRVQNGVLTFTHLGADASFKVGSQKCGHGRMYILSKGDKCTIEKVKIIVREEKREIPEEATEEVPEDKTEPVEHQEDTLDQESLPSAEDSTQPETILEDDEAEEPEENDDEFEYIEEEVYVDEDGNEVDAPVKEKKPGLFARLFKRNKAPKEEKKKEEKKPGKDRFALKLKGKKKHGPIGGATAGPLSRFFGLLYTLLFFSLFVNNGLPLIEEASQIKVTSITSDLWKEIEPLLTKVPETLPAELAELPYVNDFFQTAKTFLFKESTFHFITLFLAFEIIFQFLLAIPFGHFLIGLKNNGNGILSRILSPLRVLLGWILMPLLIFDLPIILRKRSFKEVITGSRYTIRGKRLTFFLATFILPLFATALLNLPLLLDYSQSSAKIAVETKPMPIHKSKFNETEFSYKSLAFGVEGTAYLDPRIRFVPGIVNRGKKFFPILTVIHPAKSNIISVTRKVEVTTLDKLKKTWAEDPLLTYIHHDLEDQKEILRLIHSSFALTPKNAHLHVKDLGPFLGPYYSSAKSLKLELSDDPITQVTLFEGKKNIVLQTRSLRNDLNLGIIQLRQEDADKKVLDVLMSTSDLESEKFNNEILEKTFYLAKPFKGTYSSVVSSAINQKDVRTLALIAQDVLYQITQKKKVSKSESQIITKLFLQLSKNSIKEEDEPFQLQLLDIYKKIDKALQRINPKNSDGVLTDLRLSLNRIQKALFTRDQRFFEVNK